jgi:hypothetical protein
MIKRIVALLNGASFHRGLALGALVGAAIAGSTIWSRINGARSAREHEPAGTEGPDRTA